MDKLLIIGGNGFVGANLTMAAHRLRRPVAYTYRSANTPIPEIGHELDLENKARIKRCVERTQPDCIIFCATSGPSGTKDENYATSVDSVRELHSLVDTEQTRLIYVSTNAVFTGQKGLYSESDAADVVQNPLDHGHYGVARAMGEALVLENWPNSIIARTADVTGRDVAGRVHRRLGDLISKLRNEEQVPRYSQCYISPTLVDDLVKALLEISRSDFKFRGILHLAGPERTTYFGLARLLAEHLSLKSDLVVMDRSKTEDRSLNAEVSSRLIKTRFRVLKEQFSSIFPAAE